MLLAAGAAWEIRCAGCCLCSPGGFPGLAKEYESFTKVYPQILHIVLDILGKNGYNTV